MPAGCRYQEEEKVMKIKWFSNVMSSLFALTLIFGSMSMASAKGPDGGKSQEKPAKGHEQQKKKIVIKSSVGKNWKND